MKLPKLNYTLLLALLLPYLLPAQQSLTLSEAIATGLANNYQIRLAKVDTEIAALENDWAIAGRYPSLSFTLNSNNGYVNNTNPASIVVSSSIYSTGITPGLELNWTLFDGYRVQTTKEQLATFSELSEGQLQLQVENTIAGIIQAYYAALVERERRDVLQEVLSLSGDRIEYQEVRQEFGQAGTFDLLQAQDAYFNDSTAYLIQLTTYENALRNLKLVMGLSDPDLQLVLTDSLTYAPEDFALPVLRQRLLAANRSLQNQAINRELAHINTQLAESEKLPQVNLRLGANYNIGLSSGSQTFNFSQSGPEERPIPEVAARSLNGFFNVSASYLIWNGGARDIRIQTARLNEMSAQLSYEATEQDLLVRLGNTLASYNNQKELVALTGALVNNAEQNLGIAGERFRGGIINSFDYRTIQLSYINAVQQRLNAVFNLKVTETELIRLTGGLVRTPATAN